MNKHIHCGTPECCGECTSEKENNEMSIKELMDEIEKLKARVEALEKELKINEEELPKENIKVDVDAFNGA